ncbi:MAG: AAA family ATPase, partial [Nostocoides sp.]
MAHIERLQVEAEGFLAGLDVTFGPGLNVIIGARGTGKTSIVELIRYALEASAFSDEVSMRGSQQAVAILDGGAVTVTVADGNERFTVTRSASGQVTRSAPGDVSCTVLAQNEIESVGAKASGRLHLIDRFRVDRAADERKLNNVRLTLQSLTTEVASVISDGRSLNESIASLEGVTEELEKANAVQTSLLSASAASVEQQAELERLQRAGQLIAIRESTLAGDSTAVERFRLSIQRLASEVPTILSDWPGGGGPDPLQEYRAHLNDIRSALMRIEGDLAAIQLHVRTSQSATEDLRSTVDHQSRQLRQHLENATSGISRAARA